jgi:hypothetical protein
MKIEIYISDLVDHGMWLNLVDKTEKQVEDEINAFLDETGCTEYRVLEYENFPDIDDCLITAKDLVETAEMIKKHGYEMVEGYIEDLGGFEWFDPKELEDEFVETFKEKKKYVDIF